MEDHRERLEILRDQLTESMLRVEPQVQAQLAGQLRQVLRELSEMGEVEGKSKRDELKEKRDARRGVAS